MVRLHVPRERRAGERRVAATPETVKKFAARKLAVTVETGAGAEAGFSDGDYESAGATVDRAGTGLAEADVFLAFHPPAAETARAVKEGAAFAGFLWPIENLDTIRTFAARRVSALALDALPRITRAQKMDALSSQANLAGYKAAILVAERLPKIFPMLMTAAGTIRPSKVTVLGAGVAGLSAIATCRRLGALVKVSDVRAEAKVDAESLGATYIDLGTNESFTGAGGYAREQPEEFRRKQQSILADHLAGSDAIVTTALIPYKRAPILVTAEVVARMRPGSVLVDLAAERGGNCELTVAGEVVERHGVTIFGAVHLASTIPTHASELYARNVEALLSEIVSDGALRFDLEDAIVGAALVTHMGEVRHAPTKAALNGAAP